MGRQSTFLRIVILLTVPCIIFIMAIVAVARNYLFDFFGSTQRDSLNNTTAQLAYSLREPVMQVENELMNLKPYCISKDDGKHLRLAEEMKNIYKNRREYFVGVVYIGADGMVVGQPETYWFFGEQEKRIIAEQVKKAPLNVSWSDHFYSNIVVGTRDNASYTPLVLAALPVYDDGKYQGALAAIVSISELLPATMFLSADFPVSTYLYEENGALADKLAYRTGNTFYLTPVPKTRAEFQNLKSAKSYLAKQGSYYSISTMSVLPKWSVVAVGDLDALQKKFQPFDQQFTLILVASFAGLLVIYIFVVQWWLTRPLHQLSTAIRKVGSGDFDYRIEMKRKDEFGQVANEFNRMSRMIKDLIDKLRAADQHIRQSDMAFLLSQINPHFLYNTLDAIDIMVDVSSREEVHLALRELVDLLRYGLSRDQVKKLDDELGYLRNYIGLLKLRYGEDLFDYRIEEGEGTGEIAILKLLLQPVVENAVFHGLHPLKGRKGFLLIRSSLESGVLQITVQDNGVGIPEDKLRQILQGDRNGAKTDGIGIANVIERIHLYYGKEYGMQMTSRVGEGTTAVIRIPASAKGLPS